MTALLNIGVPSLLAAIVRPATGAGDADLEIGSWYLRKQRRGIQAPPRLDIWAPAQCGRVRNVPEMRAQMPRLT